MMREMITRAELLAEDGWLKVPTGESASTDYDTMFETYLRRRNLNEMFTNRRTIGDDEMKKSSECHSTTGTGNTDKISVSGTEGGGVGGVLWETQSTPRTPSEHAFLSESGDELPVLSDMSSYASLQRIRLSDDAIVISCYCKRVNDDYSGGDVTSYQFATITGSDLVEFVFIPIVEGKRLWLELALGKMLDYLGQRCFRLSKMLKYYSLGEFDVKKNKPVEILYSSKKEAVAGCKYLYDDGRKYRCSYDWSKVERIPVVLLFHAGKVDLSCFDQSNIANTNVLLQCSEIQGGLVSMKSFPFYVNSVKHYYAKNNNIYVYPVLMSIRDTMCHAPSDGKSLEDLGKVVGWEKVYIGEDIKQNMRSFLLKDPRRYFEYASTDSVVTLLYAAGLYGYNKMIPVTVTSAGASVMKSMLYEYFNVDNDNDFDRVYRGLHKVKHGKVARSDMPGFLNNTSKEPISDKALRIQQVASNCYHGGYNGSSNIGYYDRPTFDFDLKNAYPVAMCLVPDVDWENPIERSVLERALTLDDFKTPLDMFIGYVRFIFPDSVKYPCIPINVEGVLVYPSSSEGMDGVYTCGPEVYLALKLGAEIYCESGYFLNPLLRENGEMSYSLREGVKRLVSDRMLAEMKRNGKGLRKKSLEELVLKTVVNAIYGKICQGVVPKHTWSAYKNSMEVLGPSSITNPVTGCMITSIVRAELLAAQNEVEGLGYTTYSVTTDGFISDIPVETLKTLDLYGIRPVMEKARLYLTDNKNPEIWEQKHQQETLLNFTTRGNVGLEENSVCAHNGTKSCYESDSYDDRLWLMRSVLEREDRVAYHTALWTTFKDIVRGKDFSSQNVTRKVSMDFDMKRCPVKESFYSVDVPLEGEIYEIANFTTKPFRTIEEYQFYRRKKEKATCLRTVKDWELFWFKVGAAESNARVTDTEWSILFSCVMGHRAGFWSIPELDALQGQEKCDWINAHNTSGKKFSPSDWKNAGRSDRQVHMLPKDMLIDKLCELMEQDGLAWKTTTSPNAKLYGKADNSFVPGEGNNNSKFLILN